jgi:hypothetical protein
MKDAFDRMVDTNLLCNILDIDLPKISLYYSEDLLTLDTAREQNFVIAIQDSSSPAWDDVKDNFCELGLSTSRSLNGSIWFGTKEPLREDPARTSYGRPIFVSYYTINTGYADAAARLRKSLEALDLDHDIVGVEHRGSWEENCAFKPAFVREKWRQSGRPVVWLDADATVETYPWLLFQTRADVGFHKWRGPEFSRPHERTGWEVCSGTLFVNQSAAAEALLDAWCLRCEADPMTWDQVHLDAAWADVNFAKGMSTLFLPQRYLQIFDKPEAPNEGPPIIKHWQASRQLKAGMSKSPARPKAPVTPAYVRARRHARYHRVAESLFWVAEGANHLKPKIDRDHPEGFDPGPLIRSFCDETATTIEVGCGVGRIAASFDTHNYIGIDVNPTALLTARSLLPSHSFRLLTDESELPSCGTAFLYTVALHLSDAAAVAMFSRLSRCAKRIIVSEIMDVRWRREGNPPVFNREAEDYVIMLGAFEFRLVRADRRDYEHYAKNPNVVGRDTRLTTLIFERV